MASGALGCSLPCRSRSGRPRPVSFVDFLISYWCCLRAFFSQTNDGGAGRGRGGGGEDAEDPLSSPIPASRPTAASPPPPPNSRPAPATASPVFPDGNERKIGGGGRGGGGQGVDGEDAPGNQLVLDVKVTDTTENKDAVNRMKGLLGSMFSIADKLPIFCGTIFLWLLSNSHALNSPEAGQDFKNPWMQVLITGILILCFISFILMALASKLKESESVDVVLCKIFIWLRLPVLLTLWPGLCMILHFYAHTPDFVLWPLGALFSTIALALWYLGLYKEFQKILKELKEGGVLEKDILLENPESEAALAKV